MPDGVPGGRQLRRALGERPRRDRAAGVGGGPARNFWRALTLAFLFRHPRRCAPPGALLRSISAAACRRAVRTFGLTTIPAGELRRLEPQTPRMPPPFSNRLIAPHESPRGGDALSRRAAHRLRAGSGLPDVNRDTADVLLANGCEVDTPPPQSCCGSLHAHNGELELARDLARRKIDLFPPDRYDAIITNAGGCGSHLRHYGHSARRRPALPRRGARRGTEGAGHPRVAGRRSGAARLPVAPFDDGDDGHVPRLVPPAHGQKVSRPAAGAAAAAPGRVARRAARVDWCCGSAGVYA